MLCDCLLMYLILGGKFLCSGGDACRLGLRNRQVFFLFMTHACHCNITWYGYKAKPLTAVRGHLRATSSGGIRSIRIHFPSHGKQIKFLSVCLATVACTKGSGIMLVFDVYSVAGYCGHHSGWHSKPGQSINAWQSCAAACFRSTAGIN